MKLLEAFMGLSFFAIVFTVGLIAFTIALGIIWFIGRDTNKDSGSSGFDDEFAGGSATMQKSNQRRSLEDWEQQ